MRGWILVGGMGKIRCVAADFLHSQTKEGIARPGDPCTSAGPLIRIIDYIAIFIAVRVAVGFGRLWLERFRAGAW